MKSFGISLAFAAALLTAPVLAQDAPATQQANEGSAADRHQGDRRLDGAVLSRSSRRRRANMLELRVAKKTGQRILGVLSRLCAEPTMPT
jgi:hypothetical protein